MSISSFLGKFQSRKYSLISSFSPCFDIFYVFWLTLKLFHPDKKIIDLIVFIIYGLSVNRRFPEVCPVTLNVFCENPGVFLFLLVWVFICVFIYLCIFLFLPAPKSERRLKFQEYSSSYQERKMCVFYYHSKLKYLRSIFKKFQGHFSKIMRADWNFDNTFNWIN